MARDLTHLAYVAKDGTPSFFNRLIHYAKLGAWRGVTAAYAAAMKR